MPKSSFRFRGLRYRTDAPFDREEGQGVLAEDVVLDGVTLAAGTTVWRDIDFDFVWARTIEQISIRGFEVPPGTVVELLRARPRGVVEWILRVSLLYPMMVVWVIVVGTSELLSGKWKPWRRHDSQDPHGPGSNRSPVVAFVHLPASDDEEATRMVWIHQDGTTTQRDRTA